MIGSVSAAGVVECDQYQPPWMIDLCDNRATDTEPPPAAGHYAESSTRKPQHNGIDEMRQISERIRPDGSCILSRVLFTRIPIKREYSNRR